MVRTRTMKEAAAYFRENDPQTCLTGTAIRTLLRTGAIPSAKVGKSTLYPWMHWRIISWEKQDQAIILILSKADQ